MSVPLRPTYTTYALKTIIPAAGWQAVYWRGAAHDLVPVPMLALAQRRQRFVDTETLAYVPRPEGVDDENWSVVGLVCRDNEWEVCQERASFCGLLPPEMTLATFEVRGQCRQPHEEVTSRRAQVLLRRAAEELKVLDMSGHTGFGRLAALAMELVLQVQQVEGGREHHAG